MATKTNTALKAKKTTRREVARRRGCPVQAIAKQILELRRTHEFVERLASTYPNSADSYNRDAGYIDEQIASWKITLSHAAPKTIDGAMFQLAAAFDQINVDLRSDTPVNVPNMNRRLQASRRLLAAVLSYLKQCHPKVDDALGLWRMFDGNDDANKVVAGRIRQWREDEAAS